MYTIKIYVGEYLIKYVCNFSCVFLSKYPLMQKKLLKALKGPMICLIPADCTRKGYNKSWLQQKTFVVCVISGAKSFFLTINELKPSKLTFCPMDF